MTTELDERIKRTISDVMGVPAATISESSGPDTIPSWDSLHHVHLVVALEGEFRVSFNPDDLLELVSVPAIRQAVSALQASR